MSLVLRRAALATAGVVIPLAGWGMDEVHVFAEQPARVFAVGAVGVGLWWSSGILRFRVQAKAEAPRQWLLAAVNLAGAALFLVGLPFLDARPEVLPALRLDGPVYRWAGLALLLAGLWLQIAALRALGNLFSPRVTVLEDHVLVRKGPYRFVRHPFYASLVLSAIGFPLVFASWVGLSAVAFLVPVILIRTRVEERLLEQAFGDAYADMQRKTGRLVPRVRGGQR